MRRLYNYQTIRYCPNIDSDEFFNVGIHLANDEKNVLHFINDTHLSKLMSFPSVDKNSIVKFIDILNKEVNLSHWYGNYLKFSEKKYFRSSQNFEEVLEILYEDYIGYKFHIKEKIDTIEIIKQRHLKQCIISLNIIKRTQHFKCTTKIYKIVFIIIFAM